MCERVWTLPSVISVLAFSFAAHSHEVGLNHLLHQFVKAGFMPPTEPMLCLGGVADQEVDLGRTEIASVNLDQHLPRTVAMIVIRFGRRLWLAGISRSAFTPSV